MPASSFRAVGEPVLFVGIIYAKEDQRPVWRCSGHGHRTKAEARACAKARLDNLSRRRN
jgi:hypothetical protein